MHPIALASKAKGRFALLKRIRSIAGHYGLTTVMMDQALQRFAELLCQFDCCATFPITAVTLKCHGDIIAKYLDQNIEFAVHGYTHVDYAQLTSETQLTHLQHAREVFANAGITPMGFRSPYLSRDDSLYTAIEAAGFSYVSNQPILWDVLDNGALAPSTTASYERALAFYNPWRASEHLSLPRQEDQLVEIPVALPDDEILIERLGGSNDLVKEAWRSILYHTYQRGELFTLQLHPERIALCADGLSSLLTEARALRPPVWCARLDEIATWWKARAGATIEVTDIDDGGYHCVVTGPAETTVLAHAVDVDSPTLPWADGYRQVDALKFVLHAPSRPFIGLPPSAPNDLAHFLRQQGYIFDISQESECYSCYIDQVNFDASQERTVLAQIEGTDCPLVRLGRWPNGAQSALAITGDIDALTLWDYGLRFLGK